jgi:mersacidin/lichenicidin family type 2 lantibiotic
MTVDIARAWKDPEYRKSLTPEELASLPPNPAGNPEIDSQDLGKVAGGLAPLNEFTWDEPTCDCTEGCQRG